MSDTCVPSLIVIGTAINQLETEREGDMQKYDYFFISLLNSTKDVKRVVKK